MQNKIVEGSIVGMHKGPSKIGQGSTVGQHRIFLEKIGVGTQEVELLIVLEFQWSCTGKDSQRSVGAETAGKTRILSSSQPLQQSWDVTGKHFPFLPVPCVQ